MMNDNNLTAQEKATLATALLTQRPDNTTPLHVTMHEQPAQQPQPEQSNFLNDIMRVLDAYIGNRVEQHFNQLVANTKALSLMDDELKITITELIDDAISNHENNYDHNDFTNEDRVSDILASEVDTHIDHWITHAQHDLVSESRLAEMVRDAMSEEFDEMLESKLDNATISISL